MDLKVDRVAVCLREKERACSRKKGQRQKMIERLELGSATLLQLAFLGENDPDLPRVKFPLTQQSVHNTHCYHFWGTGMELLRYSLWFAGLKVIN